jgi:hypothetical protein
MGMGLPGSFGAAAVGEIRPTFVRPDTVEALEMRQPSLALSGHRLFSDGG